MSHAVVGQKRRASESSQRLGSAAHRPRGGIVRPDSTSNHRRPCFASILTLTLTLTRAHCAHARRARARRTRPRARAFIRTRDGPALGRGDGQGSRGGSISSAHSR